tara:strand:+ start:1985 stop:2206 length:222 start_codon:yes stop_codon:yes gene_type:complete
MSQNNSDNAALYTAEANIMDANLQIAKLEYKLKRLVPVLNEIVDIANLEGATRLTTGVIVKHKVEQAQAIIND